MKQLSIGKVNYQRFLKTKDEFLYARLPFLVLGNENPTRLE